MPNSTHHNLTYLPSSPDTKAILSRCSANSAVVFVHGFWGDTLDTWSGFDDLAPKDGGFRRTDLLFFGYDGRWSNTLAAASFLYDLLSALGTDPVGTFGSLLSIEEQNARKPGYERIVVAAHSLGAVVGRWTLARAAEEDAAWRKRVQLALFAPAHCGSDLHAYCRAAVSGFRWIRPLIEGAPMVAPFITELEADSRLLKDLEDRTSRLLAKGESSLKADFVVIAEHDKVVSNRPFAGDPYPRALRNTDHRSVCKPTAKHVEPIKFIRALLPGSDAQTIDGNNSNLAFLWQSIQLMPFVRRTQNLIPKLSNNERELLFRHHRFGVPTTDAMKQRTDMDRTLGAYSLLAVGAISGHLKLNPAAEMASTIQHTIGAQYVREYHEQAYPILLPHLLLRALESKELPTDGKGTAGNDTSRSAFQWLVTFNSRFIDDVHFNRFLWLLDSGTFGSFSIKDLIARLQQPSAALRALDKPDTELSRHESSLLGMFRFLHFCRDLNAALAGLDKAPLTRSAIWFYYAYWFGRLGRAIADRTKECISVLVDGLSDANSPAWAVEEAEKTKGEILDAVVALTSGTYSGALLGALAEKDTTWPTTAMGQFFELYRQGANT